MVDVLLTTRILGRAIGINDEASPLVEGGSGVERICAGGCDDVHQY